MSARHGGVSKRKVQISSVPRPRAEHSAYDAVFDEQRRYMESGRRRAMKPCKGCVI